MPSRRTGSAKKNLTCRNALILLISKNQTVKDQLETKPDGDFLSCLRGQFPGAKFLYLADEIAPETEMSLRAGGLIFLGSYDHFKIGRASCRERV